MLALLTVFLPEAILFAGLLVVTGFCAFVKNNNKICLVASLSTMVFAFIALLFTHAGRIQYFAYNTTPEFLIIIICGMLSSVLLYKHYNIKVCRCESHIFVLSTMLGAGVILNALSILTLYVGIEMMSFSGYILVAMNNANEKSSESALKYFIIGAISSCIMLFGVSLLYGSSSDTFLSIYPGNFDPDVKIYSTKLMTTGLLFFMCGLLFKVAAAPFHIWTPDVYSGANIPSIAVISSIPKIACITLLINMVPRFATQSFIVEQVFSSQQALLFISAILSMIIGSVGAIRQNFILRIFAYSGIINVGYILAMVSLCTIPELIPSIFEFTIVYVLTTMAGIIFLMIFRNATGFDGQIKNFAGISKTMPYTSFGFAIVLLSLAGIPPLAGFFIKIKMFTTLFLSSTSDLETLNLLFFQSSNGLILIVIAALSSCASLYYYLKIVKIMYFDEPLPVIHQEKHISKMLSIPSFALVVLIISYVILLWGGILNFLF